MAKLLSIDRHAVTDYWIPNGLKAQFKAMRELKMWLIKMDDLIDWLENNQDKWDSRKVDSMALGIEPQWLKDKRKYDMQHLPKLRFSKWTQAQDSMAISMFKQGLGYNEIGNRMGRSSKGVERRLSRLDIWGDGKLKVI